jgi:hypothetical protein
LEAHALPPANRFEVAAPAQEIIMDGFEVANRLPVRPYLRQRHRSLNGGFQEGVA